MFETKAKVRVDELLENQFEQLVELLKASDLRFFGMQNNFNVKVRRLRRRAFEGKIGKKREYYIMAIMIDKKMIGYTSLRVNSLRFKRGEVGVFVADEFKGNGYGSAAVKLMIDFAFEKVELHRVAAKISGENVGAIKIMEKVGMKLEGTLVDYRMIGGKWSNSVLFAIINPEN